MPSPPPTVHQAARKLYKAVLELAQIADQPDKRKGLLGKANGRRFLEAVETLVKAIKSEG